MSQASNIVGPECGKCQTLMEWHSIALVDCIPVNVFHCRACNKFATAAVKTNPNLVVNGSTSTDQGQL